MELMGTQVCLWRAPDPFEPKGSSLKSELLTYLTKDSLNAGAIYILTEKSMSKVESSAADTVNTFVKAVVARCGPIITYQIKVSIVTCVVSHQNRHLRCCLRQF